MICHVCTSCPGGPARLALIRQTLAGRAVVRGVDCLSGCRSGGAVACVAPAKTAYLFGPVGADDMPGLAAFLHLYDASDDGRITDARRLGSLRFKALARIPPA